MASSIFDLTCSECRSALTPFDGTVWRCPRCHHRFEVCGNYVVDLSATPEQLPRRMAIQGDLAPARSRTRRPRRPLAL